MSNGDRMTTGYKKRRPKGYAPWNPHPPTQAVVNHATAVLEQYAAELPLSVRQIFYLLVANCGYEKSEKGYKALGDYMVRARRARMIPFESIRDDGCKQTSVPGWSSPEGMLRTFIEVAKEYEQNKRVNQRNKVYVLVEAQGMVPQVERLASPYGVVVVSSGGFDSLTAKKSLADSVCAIVKAGDRSTFLHVGDYAPSGVCIYDAIKADVEAFVEDEVTAHVADVVDNYGLDSGDQDRQIWFAITGAESTDSESVKDEVTADDYSECDYPWDKIEHTGEKK